MKALLIIFSFMISYSFASDCVKLTDENLCMKIEWTEGPELGVFSSNIVKFIDLDHSNSDHNVYRDPAYPVDFYGWMIMGRHAHGTRPVETTVLEPGVYSNQKVFFMKGMKGTWQFNAKINGVIYTLFSKKY